MHESTRDMYDGTIVNLWIEFHKEKKKSESVDCDLAKQKKLAITCYFLRRISIIKKRKLK